MTKANVGAITVTTAATARVIGIGGEIEDFTVDNRSAATLYVNYDGTGAGFRQIWSGDAVTIPVRQTGVQNLLVYVSAATAAGEIEIDITPVRYRPPSQG